jgi:sugar lactone lactonase YvrE
VHAYRPAAGGRAAAHESWQFDRFTGSLAECRSGGLIATQQDRIVRFDPARGLSSLEELVVLEGDRPSNRLNDGKTNWKGPSCPTFGGPDHRTLFVTSARYLMSPQEDREDTEAGSLYAITLDDVQGVPANLFAL